MFGLVELCCAGFSFLVSVSLVSLVSAGMVGKSKGVNPADVMDWLLDFLLGASKCGADVLADGGSDGDAGGNSDAERSETLAPKDDARRRRSDSMMSTAAPVPAAELTQRCAISS